MLMNTRSISSYAREWCTYKHPFTQTVHQVLFLTGLILGLTVPSVQAGQNPADSLTDQRRSDGTWLRLEHDRKVYKATQPKGDADKTRERDLRLQQQGARDRQTLSHDKQAARTARKKTGMLQSTPGYAADHRRGAQRLKADRRQNQLRLQNRIQRYSWPRN